jgi:nucleotide-binding universal stress UspA family protein
MAKTLYVIATDLSRDSARAAEVAARLAERTRASLDFFCAFPADAVDEYGIDLARARAGVEALGRRHAEGASKSAAHVAVVRDVSAAILRHARQVGAGLLVVAPHGATGWKRVLLGSVTEKVLRHATCSVLVARPDERQARGRILVGVDRGPAAETTMRHAVALARALRASVTAVHVVRPAELLLPLVAPKARGLRGGDARLAAKAQEFRNWVGAFPCRGVRVDARVIEGSPAETLVGEATRHRPSVVVVGAGGGGRVRRALLGSVARAVAATCPASVLVVRAASAAAR